MTHNKIITPEVALSKYPDTNTVLVSGIFDILHYGHISFLREAKATVSKNGKLILVTYPDSIIKEKKGEDRPIMSLRERTEMLAELESVDSIIVWDGWEDVTKFVKKLKPKYLAITSKSYDHSNAQNWQGETWDEVAKEINAQIVRIRLEGDYSSRKYSHLFD